MPPRIVHLTYAGTSGATTAALAIARGSATPARHAYVFYGVGPLRDDYPAMLAELGCQWRHAPKRAGWDRRGYRAAAEAVVSLSPAVAVMHGSRTLPVLLSLRRRVGRPLPVIGVQHGPAREVTEWHRRWVCTWFSRLADATVTVSQEMAELIGSHRRLRRATEPLRVIPNGQDAGYWSAEPPTIDPSGAVPVGMVATLETYKDQPTLLRAAADLRATGRDVRLHLVGSGPLEAALRGLADELGLTEAVTFHGTLARDAVRDQMHGWGVYAHAAHCEALPMAVIEAMLSARPIVAPDAPGLRRLIAHERTGLLCLPADPASLAAAVARVIDEPAFARRLASAARQFAREHFSAERMAGDYEAAADAMLAQA